LTRDATDQGAQMGIYNRHILPRLLDLAMRNRRLASYRARAITAARGFVLEIGVGSGLNLALYGSTVERVCAIDPAPKLLRLGGGCHLDRKMDELIRVAGFRIDAIETGYMRGPKPWTFMYQGRAEG